MSARFATNGELLNWNSLVLNGSGGGSIFSSFQYGEIKRSTDYKPLRIINKGAAFTILEKNTALGKLWYIPKGPSASSVGELHNIIIGLRPLAKKRRVFTIRIESELPLSEAPKLEKLSYVKTAPIIPSASTITLDISGDEAEILVNIPQKGRHAIKRAERDGVKVKEMACTEENCRQMYSLLEETAAGQFGIRNYDYYKTYWQTFQNAGLGQLFFAYYEGRVVSGAFALIFGENSIYKDGASIRQRTAYGASHLLQWHLICWAKSRGAKIHDFCGSPPSSEINNQGHPHYGIGRFKLSFSKNVVDYIGCYDYPISRLCFFLWQHGIERLTRRAYYKRTGDYYY